MNSNVVAALAVMQLPHLRIVRGRNDFGRSSFDQQSCARTWWTCFEADDYFCVKRATLHTKAERPFFYGHALIVAKMLPTSRGASDICGADASAYGITRAIEPCRTLSKLAT